MTETDTVPVAVETKPEVEQVYVPGKIVVNSWGYDQTNIDYYLIVKRTKHFVTLQAIGYATNVETGFLTGDCTPDPNKPLDKPLLRRKVHVWDGKEQGIDIEFGWCSLWHGGANHWSSYH